MPRASTGTAIFPRWVDIIMPKRMEESATTVLDFIYAGSDDAPLQAFARASLIQQGQPTPTPAAITAEANVLIALLKKGAGENTGAPTTPPLPTAPANWVAKRWAGTYVQAMQKFASVLLDEDSDGKWHQSTEALEVMEAFVASSGSSKPAADWANEIADDYNDYVQQKVGAAALWIP